MGFSSCTYEIVGNYKNLNSFSTEYILYKTKGIIFEEYKEFDEEKFGSASWADLKISISQLPKGLRLKKIKYVHNVEKAHSRLFFIFLDNCSSFIYEFSYGHRRGNESLGQVTFKLFSLPKQIKIDYPFVLVEEAKPSAFISEVDQIRDLIKKIIINEGFLTFNYYKKNCYYFTDILFKVMTGISTNMYEWFCNEITSGKTFMGINLKDRIGAIPSNFELVQEYEKLNDYLDNDVLNNYDI